MDRRSRQRVGEIQHRPRAGYHPAVFSFEGDQFLERLVQRLEEAPEEIHAYVAQDLQESMAQVIDEQFDKGVDPYDVAYIQPLDGGTPMQRSGALRSGIRVVAQSNQDGVDVNVEPGVPYAKYLQYGTKRMAPRRIVPGQSILAVKWRQAGTDAYRKAVEAWIYGLR